MVGKTLLHYRILRRLGGGGMGEVYAAVDERLQRQVALKVLPPDMAADPERLQRFQREARAVAALNHPHVVTLYSVEEDAGVHFLTMELVEGSTLDAIIPAGGLPLGKLLALAVPLVEAVAFAHEHGIIHRDLKPSNVMLGADGRLKVLDFGLAKLKADDVPADTTHLPTQTLTRRHVVVGTAAYMSPEQAEGRPIDRRTDIFSLGIVLYEMACGKRPFRGDSDLSLISSILKDTPSPPSLVRRDLPPALDRLIMKALAKDPAQRHQRAADLRADLAAVRERSAASSVVSGFLGAVTPAPRLRKAALAAVVLAAAGGGAWYALAGRAASVGPASPAPARFRTTRLSAQSGVEQFPSLLPDGKWVLYAGQETGNFDIYLLSTSGQNSINLTEDSPADDDEPAASPDGERIAFRSARDGGGIFVMGRTGEGVRRVTPTGVSAAFNPAWSPDGTEIAYTTENVQLTPLNWETQSELWVVDVTTGAQRKLDVGDAVQASWSPHGQRIAYVSRQQQAASGDRPGGSAGRVMDVYTIPAGGGPPVPATNDQATDWSPVWAPDGSHLYFVSERGGSMNLWRVAIDEASGRPLGEPEPISTPAPFLAHPSVAADGRRIAYSAVSQTSNIQRLTLDPAAPAVKGEPSWVTTGSRLWANPDPTPDGEWVVFYSRDQPEGDVYVSRPDGTGLRQLTSGTPIDRVPRWSPDKTWVAFFSNRAGPLQVWRIRAADGSDLQQVTEMGGIPAWSPDGKRIATSLVLGGSAVEPAVYDANQPASAQAPVKLPLPEPPLRPFIPISWSPDGAQLAGQIGFSDRGGAGVVLYTFARRAYERLTDFGEWPAWFGDGRRILFVFKGREFWVVDTRTKQARKIYGTVRDVLGPPRITRDARAVYYSRRVTEADIYLLTFE